MAKSEELTKQTEQDDYFRIANRVSILSLGSNFVLTIFKILAGIFAHSGAMISDAVHSASDVFSTIVVMIGLRISGKEADEEHPYGHERLECVASIILAVILAGVGVGIGYQGIRIIVDGDPGALKIPGLLALVASVVSIVTKEVMYQITIRAAKKIDSTALKADAWHHRSDAFSSIGALLGIVGARMGFPILDPLASVVICIFILKAALDIFMDAVNKMVDKACDKDTTQAIKEAALSVSGVLRVDTLRTRMFGPKIYVDMEIATSGEITLNAAHDIAERVHDKIETDFKNVKHIMVHVNPANS